MDIFDQLEQKVLRTISNIETLQLDNMQLQEDVQTLHNEQQQNQQQLAQAAAQLIECDAERLALTQLNEQLNAQILQMQQDNERLRKDNTRLSHDNNEWAAKAEALLQALDLAEV
ncbi:MAG: hypothetical protein LRY66_17845 [Saccharospirillaceae bacterium]|nr:hypothetical protein [Saccharospirillaceae bacterium]MCD8533164.1 hypothetical protein [Saccharospirillaceae bacterium]